VESPAVTRIETRSINYVPDNERHGKVSHQGPFWFVGNFQPFTLALGFVGFNVVDVVIIKSGLQSIFGWNPVVVAAAITVIAALLAIFGHDLLHRSFRILFWISLPLWVILTVSVVFGGVTDGPAAPGGFSWVAFLAQFGVAASYNITYAPYVSDYSRYLPRDTKPPSIIASVFVGAAGSPAWLIPIGAWTATYLGASDALAGINETGNAAISCLGGVLAIVSTLVLVATMGLNAYSGMLTVVTALDSPRPVQPTRRLRVATIVVLAMAWFVVPWTAVNLTDYFFVRRGHYAIADLFTPDGIYGAWSWRGITAFVVGIAAEIPFVVLPFFVGPVAAAMGDVDIAFIVGLLVSGVVYVMLTRSLDVSHELALIESHQELADPVS
jgi:NCS1 family nucleobase:cation symporter-1